MHDAPAPPPFDDRPMIHEDWADWTTWAFALVSDLAALRDRAGRQQRLIEAVATRFAADGTLTSAGARVVSRSYVAREGGSRDARPRIESSTTLDIGYPATITLSRRDPFTELDARRLSLLHEGVRWVHAPVSSDADDRVAKLSPREREALVHLVSGKSEKEVAALLGRSRHTVHSYVKRIYRTLGVRSRAELRTFLPPVQSSRG